MTTTKVTHSTTAHNANAATTVVTNTHDTVREFPLSPSIENVSVLVLLLQLQHCKFSTFNSWTRDLPRSSNPQPSLESLQDQTSKQPLL